MGAIGGFRWMAILNLRVERTFSGAYHSRRAAVRKKSGKGLLEPHSSRGRDVV